MITRSFVWRLLLYRRARFSNSFVSSAAPGKQKKDIPKAQKQRDITKNHTQQIPTELLRPQIYYHPISTKKETRRRRRKHTRQIQTRTDPKLELSALDLNQKSSSSSNFIDQS